MACGDTLGKNVSCCDKLVLQCKIIHINNQIYFMVMGLAINKPIIVLTVFKPIGSHKLITFTSKLEYTKILTF